MHRRTRLAASAAVVAALSAGAQPAHAQTSEVVTLLQDLVRVNTSNPPGNEALVAELLRARLEPLGFQVELLPTPAPGKAHLIARLPATQPDGRKPLLLAGHSDVVGVEQALWTVDPFAGLIRGDRLYGRGAMDFKGGLAAFTVAAMRLAREGAPRTRDLILLSEADEEGGAYGTTWLAEHHWDKIDAAESINEGGWIFADRSGGAQLMGITTIDKNSLSVTFRTRGTSTHSSRPLPDSALRRLVRALNRVERYQTAPRITPTARTYLRAWARTADARTARRLRAITTTKSPAERRRLADQLRDGRWGELFDGLVRNIFVPTIVESGFRANVLPGTAEATVNLRMLPGQKPRPLIRELRRAVNDPKVRITPITSGDNTVEQTLDAFDRRSRQAPSSTDTDVYRALVREGKREWPKAVVTPALFEAGTDATPWRRRGIPVYGIYPYPISLADLQAMHGNDERVPIKGLEQGTDMLTRVLRAAVG
jgi:acetylornithine deacetylase/succinyl-diaminopimelate desuccinylase-like protein